MITLIISLSHLGSVWAGLSEVPRTDETEISRRLEERIKLWLRAIF